MDELEHMPTYDATQEPEPEDPVKPYREAGQKREQMEEILAEHDELMAELLFDTTMLKMGMEE